MYLFAETTKEANLSKEQRQLALEYIAQAWNDAEQDGLEGEAIAHAALFAAIATLVKDFGEGTTADLIAKLPERIRSGEYSLSRSIQ